MNTFQQKSSKHFSLIGNGHNITWALERAKSCADYFISLHISTKVRNATEWIEQSTLIGPFSMYLSLMVPFDSDKVDGRMYFQ